MPFHLTSRLDSHDCEITLSFNCSSTSVTKMWEIKTDIVWVGMVQWMIYEEGVLTQH